MVFSSYEFLLVFLPAAYVGFLLVHRLGGWPAVFPYLGAASLVFYAQWSLALAGILLASVLVNFAAARLLVACRARPRAASLLLAAAVLGNLGALGYFKYANFFIDTVNGLAGSGYSHIDLLLPVGISFYTFIQIGYLVEARIGQAAPTSFGRYLLFATFFPCVTAGPLVLQREMFDQMKDRRDPAFDGMRLAVGLTLFAMGMFKKVVLADAIAPYADQMFDGVAAGAGVDLVNAWVGALCYTLQLYFDFSGYSDMAVGLGFAFGIRLPLNFNSPLKATSITDFWRRWHMTMTRFFTNYVYTPLALRNTRTALLRRYGRLGRFASATAWPIILTFVVAGVWHGAGWTFAVYGLIHGLALAINHGWREFRLPELGWPAGWALTMATVVSGLVVFRSADLATALAVLGSMWGVASSAAPTMVELDLLHAVALIAGLGLVVLAAPNTQEILRDHWVSSDPRPRALDAALPWLAWRASPVWATAIGLALVIAATSIGSHSTFLYYKF